MEHYWLDTDIGGDIDDILALLYVLHSKVKLHGISTCHINPKQKADIAKTILDQLGIEVPVYIGDGWHPEQSREEFLKISPMWPTRTFDVPNPGPNEKLMYSHQGEAYEKIISKHTVSQTPLWDVITNVTESIDKPLNIICLGPLHNIDDFLFTHFHLKHKIKLWVMGGWKRSKNGTQVPGYNTGVHPRLSEFVFNSGVKIMLINSQFIRDHDFNVTQEDYEKFRDSRTKSKLAECILQDWIFWNNRHTFTSKRLADPVTAFLALNPDYILETKYVKITVPEPRLRGIRAPINDTGSDDGFMTKGLNLIDVTYVEKSNIQVVTKVKDPREIYSQIMTSVFEMLNV